MSTPSARPSDSPSHLPTAIPSCHPTASPSLQPSSRPSQQPMVAPSKQPWSMPSALPSIQPSSQPSLQPLTSHPTVYTPLSPPNISSIVLTTTNNNNNRTQLMVTVELAATTDNRREVQSSILHCGAFLRASPLPSSTGEIVRQNRFGYFYPAGSNADNRDGRASSGIISSVLMLSDLTPSTAYRVICMTTTAEGVQMTLSNALRRSLVATTGCCKEVLVAVALSSVFEHQTVFNAILISLSAAPSTAISVVAHITAVATIPPSSSSGVDASRLFPAASWTIDSQSFYTASSVYEVSFIAGDPAVYLLTLTVSGPAAAEFAVVYSSSSFSGGQMIKVIGADTAPPTPKVQLARFSNDGAYVQVLFDSATNKGGDANSFHCAKLFAAFPSSNIHQSQMSSSSSSCRWEDESTVLIFSLQVTVGSAITVIAGNTVRAKCSSSTAQSCTTWQTVASQSVIVAAPFEAVAPTVVFSAPSAIGECSSFVMDLSNSVGAAGRAWSRIEFTVTQARAGNSVAAIERFLNHNYTLSPPMPLPARSLLEAGQQYNFIVKLCNFLGACGDSSHALSVVASSDGDGALPTVTILGSNRRDMTRSQPLILSCKAFIELCTGAISFSNLRYAWKIYEIGSNSSSDGESRNTARSDLFSESQNPTMIKLPAFALKVNAEYEVEVRVAASSSSTAVGTAASVKIFVGQSEIVAKISGGAFRTVQFGETFSVDASGSFDRDQDRSNVQGMAAAATGLLSFRWKCMQLAPSITTGCSLTPVTAGAIDAAIMHFVSNYSAINTTSRISVSVFDASRSSSAFTDVSISSVAQSVLSIASSISDLSSVLTDRKFSLVGTLSLVYGCEASWAVNDPTIDLKAMALTPLSARYQASSNNVYQMILLIAANALPQSASLTFTLACGLAKTSIAIKTNGAPQPGVLLVDPLIGVAIETLFSMAAQGWVDVDLPMKYRFGFLSDGNKIPLSVVSDSELSYCATQLSAGSAAKSFYVTCVLSG